MGEGLWRGRSLLVNQVHLKEFLKAVFHLRWRNSYVSAGGGAYAGGHVTLEVNKCGRSSCSDESVWSLLLNLSHTHTHTFSIRRWGVMPGGRGQCLFKGIGWAGFIQEGEGFYVFILLGGRAAVGGA